jgi:hypothetical protein
LELDARQHCASCQKTTSEQVLSHTSFFGGVVPMTMTVFPDEYYRAPRSWVEAAYPKVVYFSQTRRGGHFAAWEEPLLLSEELRAALRFLR